MSRIDRRSHRCSEVHIAQTEHEVTRLEHDSLHVVYRVEAVDTADELEVPGAPRRIRADALHVTLGREPCCRVVPREGQVDDATWDLQVGDVPERVVEIDDEVDDLLGSRTIRVEADLQRANAGNQLADRC